jgi:hypothetical protein
MNSPDAYKLTGLNAWFIIEILSFYGYILSAIFFIFEKMVLSSLGRVKRGLCDRYKYDFLYYHRKDLDWLAFVCILFLVNICLIAIDERIIFIPENPHIDLDNMKFPLRPLTYILLCNHAL